jgi:hypothetical protein
VKRGIILVASAVLFLTIFLYAAPVPPAAKAQSNEPAQTYSDDFSSDSGNWQYLGSAYRNATNQQLVLTTSANDQTGIAVFKAPLQGSFVTNFSFKCDPSRNDGLVMFFFKQQYPSNLDYEASYGTNGIAGGRTGFNSQSIIPGYGIEFDGWANIASEFDNIVGGQPNPAADPSSNHIALIKDFTGDHLAYVDGQNIRANDWHQVSVDVQGASVDLYVDNGLVLEWNGSLNRTYSGFGFSASNGMVLADSHLIDNLTITAQNLQQPTLTTLGTSSVSESSFRVKIGGSLTLNGTAISGAPILLAYSVTGGESWQDLTLVYTASDGSYVATWLPSVTGNYILKALYQGNETLLGTTNIVNFALEPCETQSAFSVTSNSTLSALTFDSASRELSFSVSGDSGTTGYVNVNIPKSLVSDVSGLKVYLDSTQIDYTAQSQGDSWLLYLTYHHSSHSVMISLASASSPSPSLTPTPTPSMPSEIPSPTPNPQTADSLVEASLAVAILVVAVAAVLLGRRKAGSN